MNEHNETVKSPTLLLRRHLRVMAVACLILGAAVLLFSAKAWLDLGQLPMPDNISVEMHRTLREAFFAVAFVVLPLCGCFFLVLGAGILREVWRIRETKKAFQSTQVRPE